MIFTLFRAEDGAQTRDPQLGRLMLYRLSYFRSFDLGFGSSDCGFKSEIVNRKS